MLLPRLHSTPFIADFAEDELVVDLDVVPYGRHDVHLEEYSALPDDFVAFWNAGAGLGRGEDHGSQLDRDVGPKVEPERLLQISLHLADAATRESVPDLVRLIAPLIMRGRRDSGFLARFCNGAKDPDQGARRVGAQVHQRPAGKFVSEADVIVVEHEARSPQDRFGPRDIFRGKEAREFGPGWVEEVVHRLQQNWRLRARAGGQNRVTPDQSRLCRVVE